MKHRLFEDREKLAWHFFGILSYGSEMYCRVRLRIFMALLCTKRTPLGGCFQGRSCIPTFVPSPALFLPLMYCSVQTDRLFVPKLIHGRHCLTLHFWDTGVLFHSHHSFSEVSHCSSEEETGCKGGKNVFSSLSEPSLPAQQASTKLAPRQMISRCFWCDW